MFELPSNFNATHVHVAWTLALPAEASREMKKLGSSTPLSNLPAPEHNYHAYRSRVTPGVKQYLLQYKAF